MVSAQCPEYPGTMSGISRPNVWNVLAQCPEYPAPMSGISVPNARNICGQPPEYLCAVSCEGVRADHIPDRINQFGTVGVLSIRPIIACTGLPEDEVVYPEGLAKGARAGAVHGPARGPSKWHVAQSVIQLLR